MAGRTPLLDAKGDQTVDRDRPVDCGRFLVAIKIYLPHQYEEQLFVWQKVLDPPTSAKKPSPTWR